MLKRYVFVHIFIVGLLLVQTPMSWSATKAHCVSKELRLKNCRIKSRSTELNLSKEAVRVFDGTWRGVVPIPAVEKITDWKSVKLRAFKKYQILEMKVWQKESRAVSLEMEALHWILFEVSGTQLSMLSDKVIQRRRRKAAEGDAMPHPFLVGKMESHMILVEDGELLWKVGHNKGKLTQRE